VEKIDDLRERLTLQMYDFLAFMGDILDREDTDEGKVKTLAWEGLRVGVLHKWWEREGYDLDAELGRIRERLDAVAKKAAA
jgi:hypothetical protein